MRESQLIKIAKALADPTRLKMLHELRASGELTCSQVCECFPQSQPTISHHIKTLEGAGLISIRREGQFHVLKLDKGVLAEFAEAVASPNEVQEPRTKKAKGAAAAARG